MKKEFSIINSQTGSAILQAMLAFAMVAGVGVAVMKSVENSNKSIKSSVSNDDMGDLTSQISKLLSSSAACLSTFQNLNARSSANVYTVKDHVGTTIITAGSPGAPATTKFGTSNTSIESIRLSDMHDPSDSNDDVNVVTNGPGTTYAIVTFNKQDKSFFSNRAQIKKVKLYVRTNSSDLVTACHSMASAVDSVWQREIPSQNINYTSGNVGIGLQSPAARMDVNGWVSATTPSNDKIAIGGSSTEYQIRVNADKPIVFKDSAGSNLVGIEAKRATAEKKFVLKPVVTPWSSTLVGNPGRTIQTPSSTPCTSDIEGAMRTREIKIRPAFQGTQALTIIRTQVCSDFGGVWKWRSLAVKKYRRSTGAGPCTPSPSARDCIDSSASEQ